MDGDSFSYNHRPNTSSTSTYSQLEADSSSSNHGWSFMQSHHLHNDPNMSPRSLPPSTYMRSSDSTSSRSPIQNHSSRSPTLSRSLLNQLSTSTGHRSTATNPSLPPQPVLLRINSGSAYTHTSLVPRRTHSGRPIQKDKSTQLPAAEEFSIQGILSAIEEDIEDDLAVISEVLGRSRFVLADQHESQMAPLGEIRGVEINGDEENWRSAGDEVMILREDASLVDGSNSGSAAYGLLERLQAVPRTANNHNLGLGLERTILDESPPLRNEISPPEPIVPIFVPPIATIFETRELTATRPEGPARAVVSETHYSAEADGVSSGAVPMVFEDGKYYPLFIQDDVNVIEDTTIVQEPAVPVQRRSYVPGFNGIASWLSRGSVSSGGGGGASSNGEQDAEARLRNLLNR